MDCSAMSNYDTPATGRLWTPINEETDEPDIEAATQKIQALEHGDPLVTSQEDKVTIDELWYSDGCLNLTIVLGGWLATIEAPLRPNDDLRELLRELNTAFDITARESGYYLSNDDVAFVDTFTPDEQGRVTLGREYAGQNVKVVGSVDE